MVDTDLFYENTYQVRAYEIDSRQRMTIPALSRLMQEAALQNVIEIGMSFWDLEPYKISWVLNRQQIYIKRMPKMNEPIRVHTTPAGFLRFFTLRDYRVFSASGELIAHSPSIWLLMNTQTREMATRPPFLQAFETRMPPRSQCFERPKGKLPSFERADFTNHYRVHWHNLDFNKHLNNTLYKQWMLDPLPAEVLDRQNLTFLDINYRAECQLHDDLRSEVQQLSDTAYLHRILRLSDGKLLASARTSWSETSVED
jgi:medium-chain acyl-[acyl-carrier-protein] hydrolase